MESAPTQDWSVDTHAMQDALKRLPPEPLEALIQVGAAGPSYEEASDPGSYFVSG